MINWSVLADGKLQAIGPKRLRDLHGETISLTLIMHSVGWERHLPVHVPSIAQNIRDLGFVQ